MQKIVFWAVCKGLTPPLLACLLNIKKNVLTGINLKMYY